MTSLRSAGVAVWDLVVAKPLRQHLRDLTRLAIPHSVIIGTKELHNSNYTVRFTDGTLHVIAKHHIAEWLHNHRHRNL